MHRDIFTNKWILGGFALLIIIAGACYVWYQYTTAQYRAEAEKTNKLLQDWEANKAKPTRTAETTSTQAPAEKIKTAEKPITDTTQDNETTNIETNTDNSVIADTTENVRMSPHGFGAFPQIPEGAPIAAFDETISVQQELMCRVLVKLWNDGDRHIGGGWISGKTGRVYPHYDNVIYVRYETEFNQITGRNETKITRATSGPDNFRAVNAVTSGDIPSGYTLIDVDESGINPYEYLDLPIR